MPRARLELARLTTQASKTCVATNYTISADTPLIFNNLKSIE